MRVRLKLALLGVGRIIRRPKYLLTGILIALLFSTLVYFIINGNIYGSLLLSRLPFVDKLGVIGMMLQAMAVEWFTTLNGGLLMVVSLLQGVAMTLLVYTFKRNREDKSAAKQLGQSGVAAVAAAIGLGCVPCGTSLLLPIIAIFLSGSAAASAANIANGVVLILALLISLYSIYKIGYIAYIHTENEKLSTKGKSNESS